MVGGFVERKPQHLSRQRAQCASQEVVDIFFRRLKNLFETSGFKDAPDLSNRIWNCDETGFCTAVASKAVLTRRGAKEVHETAGGSGRDYITVLGKCLVLWCVTSTFFLFLYVSIHIFLLIFGGGRSEAHLWFMCNFTL